MDRDADMGRRGAMREEIWDEFLSQELRDWRGWVFFNFHAGALKVYDADLRRYIEWKVSQSHPRPVLPDWKARLSDMKVGRRAA